MTLDTRSLRHVVTLAAHGSYRRAAAALHISQPALSRSITALEATLGVRLFDRDRRGVRPTTFGRLLIERGGGLLAGFEELRRELALTRGLESGELSVGAGLYPAEMSVGTALGRLSARHPQLRVSLLAAPWREVAEAVTAGELDVAVVELSALQGTSRLTLDPLPRHPATVVCRPGHPLLALSRLTTAKVFAFPFVGPRLPPRLGDLLRPVAPLFRRDPASGDVIPPLQVESIALAKKIVAAGDGIAALPRVLVAAELASGQLAALRWRAPWLHTGYGFVYRRDRTLSPAAQAFIAEVRAIESDLQRRSSQHATRRPGTAGTA
jgi:DNA-binding transcriptional LysR family regulator